jgi:hypothetical protein
LLIVFQWLKGNGMEVESPHPECFRERTCNIQPGLLLMPALLLIAPKFYSSLYKNQLPYFCFSNDDYARRNPQ